MEPVQQPNRRDVEWRLGVGRRKGEENDFAIRVDGVGRVDEGRVL